MSSRSVRSASPATKAALAAATTRRAVPRRAARRDRRAASSSKRATRLSRAAPVSPLGAGEPRLQRRRTSTRPARPRAAVEQRQRPLEADDRTVDDGRHLLALPSADDAGILDDPAGQPLGSPCLLELAGATPITSG